MMVAVVQFGTGVDARDPGRDRRRQDRHRRARRHRLPQQPERRLAEEHRLMVRRLRARWAARRSSSGPCSQRRAPALRPPRRPFGRCSRRRYRRTSEWGAGGRLSAKLWRAVGLVNGGGEGVGLGPIAGSGGSQMLDNTPTLAAGASRVVLPMLFSAAGLGFWRGFVVLCRFWAGAIVAVPPPSRDRSRFGRRDDEQCAKLGASGEPGRAKHTPRAQHATARYSPWNWRAIHHRNTRDRAHPAALAAKRRADHERKRKL